MNENKLQPGRELDLLVAEKVMGWDWVRDDLEWFGELVASGPHAGEFIPHYSTDIAAAWELIERHPHYVYLVRSNDNGRFGWKEKMDWKCRFYAPESYEVTAETAPLAICLAALKAIG